MSATWYNRNNDNWRKMELNCELTQRVINALQANGVQCYIVGGFVRDTILGVKSKDIDIELHNTTLEHAYDIISEITDANIFGTFGIISLTLVPTEFAIARTERKTGNNHTSFEIEFITNGDLKLAASRRDFTINSLMYDLQTNQLVDNFNGVADLQYRILRHVSPAFSEDPLRVLRGIKFMSRYNLTIAAETRILCYTLISQLTTLSTTRIQNEMEAIFQAPYFHNVSQLLTDVFSILSNQTVTYAKYDKFDVESNRLLFFKQFDDYEIVINMCYEQKLIKKDLIFCLNNFEQYQQFSTLSGAQKYELLSMSKNRLNYISAINSDILDYYQKYTQLVKKYNGQYFMNLGYQGKEIKKAMKSEIGKRLNEL